MSLSILASLAAAAEVQTLEDIYGDTAETFQAALGFINFEGTPSAGATQSYGVALDDMVVSWREFTLETDATDCDVSGSCAVIELSSSVVYGGQSLLTITVMEPTPPAENDCDLDGTPDGTDDCDGNGTVDLVVRAGSAQESPGEIVFLDRVDEDAGRYTGQVPLTSLGDTPGALFIEQNGAEIPTVTVTYRDDDIGTGEPCPNDVDPAKHGFVQGTTTVQLGQTCVVTFIDSLVTDNGDGDIWVDTGEIADMQVTYRNDCGIDLHNCVARITPESSEVDCVLDPLIDLSEIPSDGQTHLSLDAFRWKLRDDVARTSIEQQLSVEFKVTLACDEIDALAIPQSLTLELDLDLLDAGQTPVAWEEGFESGTLGRFTPENLDAGLPGADNTIGLILGDGWRCQYSDPDWPNSNSYGDTTSLDCFPGMTLEQSNAIFWQVDGPGLNLCDGGRAKSGSHSMYYGICLTDPAGDFTTPLSVVESVATRDPINLGLGSQGPTGTELHLSWWHQISLIDGTFLGVGPLISSDAGVVQLKTVDAQGNDSSDWTKLEAFQNGYDAQRYDFYFNCMFDPVDDGNTEDDFFDPLDPERRLGPSSTCFPEFVFARLGDTDEPFMPDNVGRATTPPGVDDEPDLGLGTWVESRVNLSAYRGRRVLLRFLVSSIKATAENHQDQFGNLNDLWYDDGWWIDDVRIDDTLTNPAPLEVDDGLLQGCAGDPSTGCLTDQDCVDSGAGGPCNQPAPGCGPVCEDLTAVVTTFPETGGGSTGEVLEAPGQAIEINAVDSFGVCIDGALQYRFSVEGGPELRGWSENPIWIDAPPQDVDYRVEVRCTSELSCTDSVVVDVDVACPTSGELQSAFPETILAQSSKTDWSWTTPLDYDLFVGDLSAVASYGGSLSSGTGDGFSDGASPGSGAGFYYVVRESGEFCNDSGLWTSQGPAESPFREDSLP